MTWSYIKPGADMRGLHPRIWDAIACAAYVYGMHGKRFRVTSGIEDHEGWRSWHNDGRAVDIGVRGLTDQEARTITAELVKLLGDEGYDVVYEPNAKKGRHIHIEWDPK